LSSVLLTVGLAVFGEASFAGNCNGTNFSTNSTECACQDASFANQALASRAPSGGGGINPNAPGTILQCSGLSDTTCGAIVVDDTSSPQFYKNTSTAPAQYFKCNFLVGSGFVSASMYTPGGGGGAVSAPIDLHFSKQVETYSTEIELK